MAMTIKHLLSFSWMSQASYLDFAGLAQNSSGDVVNGYLTNPNQTNADKIFSAGQATAFTDPTNGFSFINYTPNDAAGFSATVFKSNSATNDYTIAVRGTEPLGNPLSDLGNADVLGVGLQGAAYKQLISAYRYYKQLTTANGLQVSYSAAELAKLGAMYNLTLLSPDAALVSQFITSLGNVSDPGNWGTGAINATTANIHFTGHSLGGHVATLLASMVQEFGQGNVADVMTYNAPGQGGLFGVNPLTDVTAIATKITNVIGDGGMTFTPLVGNLSGYFEPVFIETNSVNPIGNHSIVKLSDSLAVYNLLSTLDPNPNTALNGIGKITDILKASSNIAANSLESAVSALGKLFNIPGTAFSSNEFDSNRDLLYVALKDITAGLPKNVALSLVAVDTATLLADASGANGLAYRYALVNGNPFAITGPDYGIHNTSGELDLYNPANGTGSLTNQYLTDRAEHIKWQLQANVQDKSVLLGDKGPQNTQYEDLARHSTLTVNGDVLGFASTAPARKVIFGSDFNDDGSASLSPVLQGGTEADRLYGMGGNDTLRGNGGNDYLEGGTGNDTLNGDGDNGSFGSPNGTPGDDILMGGAGHDTYLYSTGGGHDTITDKDGNIQFDGATLSGGIGQKGSGVYRSSDGTYTYAWTGGDLVINPSTGSGQAITVKNFSNNDLGIHLDVTEDPNNPPGPPGGSGGPVYNPNNASSIRRWDPLVLDLNGDGQINAVGSTASTTYFDFNGDGISEKSGWITAQDGMLALDSNGNGAIDGLGELFGTNQIDGFTELSGHDRNADGVIDAQDGVFPLLKVWQDANQDGISQATELKALDELGISAINLANTPVNIPVANNLITATGSFVQNGATRLAADINLAVNFALTDANPNRPLDQAPTLGSDVYQLPWLRGYGNVPSLQLAYQQNPALKQAAADIIAQGATGILQNFDSFMAKWTGLNAARSVDDTDNGGVACAVLFGREKREAANDIAFMQRKVA